MTNASRDWTDRATLLAGDLSDREIDGMASNGLLHRIRRGRYAPGEKWTHADEQERHRIRAAEIGHAMGGRAVLSHESAAVLLGLELPNLGLKSPNGPISRVHVTWPGSPGRRATTNVTPHRGRLHDSDIAQTCGVLTTSAARTVFDIARAGVWHRAISVADCALRLRLCTLEDLDAVLGRNVRVPGAFRARQVIEFADGRAESAGESICRLRMAQLGLPAPNLQVVIPELTASPGHPEAVGARVDFDFERHRTVAEFDGKIKYRRLLEPGQEPGDVVFAEKVREDRIRDTGREFVRVIWDDFWRGATLEARFRAAFRRAGFPDWLPAPGRFLAMPSPVGLETP